MTRYLIDTDVVSAAAPTKTVAQSEMIEWMDTHSADLFVSAVTIAEIAEGIAKSKHQGAKRKALILSAWLKTILHLYAERVLPFDSATAEIAGALSDLARGRGHSPGFADVVIAATARHHGLTVLSRNERHFAPMDVRVIDPFQYLPKQ
ncbi:MAG: type II toxin-antitoxin system VapC family toxin [Alphaproteobacteria bacterium]|nr:MAG: type II toxin-antitoxin system VapC family toxin [Alphaproteobacteria bacterium]